MTPIDKKVAFIGAGMMGSAMITGIIQGNLIAPQDLIAVDPDQAKGAKLVQECGIRHAMDSHGVVEKVNILVLAIKPQYFHIACQQLRGQLSEVDLVISIMAGVTIDAIKTALNVSSVVRAMPNTPGAIGQGMTVWVASSAVSDEYLAITEQLLGALGVVMRVQQEHALDMSTAVSGSGPAFVLLFMEAMIDAAVHLGFSRAEAQTLVMQTVKGTSAYLEVSGEHPAVLRNQVTSPAGTTAEGLYHLEREGFRHAIARAIWGAYQRSAQLGGKTTRNPDTST